MYPRLAGALVLLSCLHTGAAGSDALLSATLPAESIPAAQRRATALNLAREAARRLVEEKPATDALQDQLFTEAIDDYQRLIEESGDKLLPLDAQQRQHCVQARWLCALDLSRLPAPALRVYRNRVNNQAHKWLKRGQSERDVALLRRVVDEAFCSSYGDDALDLLGDLAFERGHFDEAERWWRHIARPATDATVKSDSADLELLFPDPDVDLARIRAKQILARLFAGASRQRLQADLRAYRQLHPNVEGVLADQKGKYADLLETLAAQPQRADAPELAWPTFGGEPERGRVLPPDPRDPNRLLRLLRDGERYRFSLDTHAVLKARPDALPPGLVGQAVPFQAEARRLAFHPVIVGPWVVTADGRSVTAHHAVTGATNTWNLANGRYRIPAKALTTLPNLPADSERWTEPIYDLRYTLTAAEGKVYARLGTPQLSPDLRGDDTESYLVCLDLPSDGKERWCARAQSADDERLTIFEGAPVAVGSRVYIAAARFAAGQTITSVRCYPADAHGEPGIRWQQDVCSVAELKPGEGRYRHHLLTLAGPNVVYCSHSGAIVAVDSRTGRPAWAVRYPSRGLRLGPNEVTPRQLTPCVCAAGRIYAAPADHDRLMCLDPVSGRTLWQRRMEVVHLYGVSLGRLVFTTPGGIRAVDAVSGKDAGGWIQPAVGGALQPPAGEGLATAEEDGLPSFGRGFLAGEYVFWPTRRRLWVLSVRDGEQPDDLIPGGLEKVPPGNLVLGDGVLAVAGTDVLSIFTSPALLKARRAAAVRAAPDSPRALYDLGAACADKREFSAALREFKLAERAGADNFHFTEEARRRQREVLREQAAELRALGRWEEADAALAATAVGADTSERLACLADRTELWVEARQPARAVELWQAQLESAAAQSPERKTAVAHITRLIQRHGPAVYAAVADRAAVARSAAKGTAELEQVAARFPHSPSAAAALTALARVYSRSGREGLATHALRLAARQADGPARSAVLDELAKSYERRGLNHSCEQPDFTAPPLTRGWQVNTSTGERLLAAAGPVLVFADGSRLICREAATGATRWARLLPDAVHWARQHADTILAADPNGVFCLTGDDGTILWRLTLPGGPLTSFQLAAGRLCFLQDGRRLTAAEADTGDVLWTRSAPGWSMDGRFHPRFLVVGEHLLVQTSSGQRWILDARTGATQHEHPTPRDPWPQPPLLLHETCVALAEDSQTVTLLDLANGKELARPLSGPSTLSSGRPPLLSGNPDTLAVLQLRNHGTTLQCFDVRSGTPRWPQEQQVSWNTPDDVAVDAATAYAINRGEVSAFALTDGRRLWRTALPGAGTAWRLRACQGGLIAYPSEQDAWQFTLGWLPGKLSLATAPNQTLAVHILDPDTGRILQRVNLPRTGPGGQALPGGSWRPTLELSRWQLRVVVESDGLAGSGPGFAFRRATPGS